MTRPDSRKRTETGMLANRATHPTLTMGLTSGGHRGCGDCLRRGDGHRLPTTGERPRREILPGIGGGVEIQEVKNRFDPSQSLLHVAAGSHGVAVVDPLWPGRAALQQQIHCTTIIVAEFDTHALPRTMTWDPRHHRRRAGQKRTL